jgi:predicted RNase H-like HicB family nuclease
MRVLEFSVLVRRAPDVEGQWIAHCLNWDLVSQGDSPSDAFQMIGEAVVLATQEDEAAELDPADRPAAPQELWDLFHRTLHSGARISSTDADHLAAKKDVVIAAVMYLRRLEEAQGAARTSVPWYTPPPFIAAELAEQNSSLC